MNNVSIGDAPMHSVITKLPQATQLSKPTFSCCSHKAWSGV